MSSLPPRFLPFPVPLFSIQGTGQMSLLPTPPTMLPPPMGLPHFPFLPFSPIPLLPTVPQQHPELRSAEQEVERNDILELLKELSDPYVRDYYITELLEKRGNSSELAPLLWHSTGSMSCLIDDIVSGYIYIADPATLNSPKSRKLCNTLKLLQCVAQHLDTRPLFLNAQIHMLLLPYLNTEAKEEPVESVRQSTLSVILALVKNMDNNVIGFLYTATAEILPLCFRVLKTELCTDLGTKLIAIDILRKVLLTDFGLFHICHNRHILIDITMGLCATLKQICSTKQINTHIRMLKYIIHCFKRLSEDQAAREVLRKNLPHQLQDSTFCNYFKDDLQTKQNLTSLWSNLSFTGNKFGKREGKGDKKQNRKENGKKEETAKHPK